MTTEITIQQIRIRVPRGGSVGNVRDGEAVANAMSQQLAQTLAGRAETLRSGKIDHVHLTVPQKQGNVLGAASEAGSAIGNRLSSPRRQR